MITLILLLLPLLSLSSENSTPNPIGPEYPVANVSKVFTVRIKDTNYLPAQKVKLTQASVAIEKVFNSPEFKSKVVSRSFDSNKGLGSSEIFDRLYRGAELLGPAVDYEMDLIVTMYNRRFSKVVGYTTPNSSVVFTNRKFHDSFSHCQVAANLTHEWSHKMGFDHKSASESNSVPYALGDIILELCQKL